MEGMTQMFVVMPVVYLARSIDWNTENTNYLRIAFGVAHVLIIAALLMLRQRIASSKNNKEIKVPKAASWGVPSEEEETMTVSEYDMREWSNLFWKTTVIPTAIMIGIHIKWEVVIPLATQIIMAPMRLYQAKLIQIYFLGATGPDTERPFKQPESPFQSMLQGAGGNDQQAKKKSTKSERAKAKKDN
jgi:hypothetical protein